MTTDRQLLNASEMQKAISRMADELHRAAGADDRPVLIGIRTHGVTLAKRIQAIFREKYAAEPPLGILDITLYRDDLNLPGSVQPVVRPTQIDFDLNDRTVLLIDDVLYTGRTIRCALDEIMDFGRPASVKLGVLIDRGRRELPIQPDVTGITVETTPEESIRVRFREADREEGAWVHTRAPEA